MYCIDSEGIQNSEYSATKNLEAGGQVSRWAGEALRTYLPLTCLPAHLPTCLLRPRSGRLWHERHDGVAISRQVLAHRLVDVLHGQRIGALRAARDRPRVAAEDVRGLERVEPVGILPQR